MMTAWPFFVQTHVRGHSLHVRHLVGSQNILPAKTLLMPMGSNRETSSCRRENVTRKEGKQP
ncbi:MAG: hypothetical protein ACI4WT_06265 [Oligosphaeraceae bacterium]